MLCLAPTSPIGKVWLSLGVNLLLFVQLALTRNSLCLDLTGLHPLLSVGRLPRQRTFVPPSLCACTLSLYSQPLPSRSRTAFKSDRSMLLHFDLPSIAARLNT